MELALATRDESNLVTLSDVESQKSLVTSLRENIVNEKNSVLSHERCIVDLESKIEKIRDFKSTFPIEDIKSSIEEKRSLEITINEKKHDIDKKKHNIKLLKKETEKLQDKPCSDSCPVNRYIAGATKALKKISKLEKELSDFKDDLTQIRKIYNN